MVVATQNTYTCTEPLLYEQTHESDFLSDDLAQFLQLQETEHDDGDNDDALSFCDLPIYSTSSSSLGNVNRNEYQEEADSFFEFGPSSKSSFDDSYHCDHDGAASNRVRDAILFCGKFIASNDAVDSENHKGNPKCQKSSPKPDRAAKKRASMFSWKRLKIASFTFRKSKKAESPHSHSSQELSPSSSKNKDKTRRRLEKISSAKKVSTLLTSPTKSRWYLFMFGQTRYSQAMTMDLSDLKNRQRRRCSPSPSMNRRASEGGSVSAQGSRSSRGKGLWALLKES
uniref:Uncharacterized protein n=1 Tax=Kalanchoe fedtschenkoi TaxID=63787 RepID=A0A7N0VJ41_KALFE